MPDNAPERESSRLMRAVSGHPSAVEHLLPEGAHNRLVGTLALTAMLENDLQTAASIETRELECAHPDNQQTVDALAAELKDLAARALDDFPAVGACATYMHYRDELAHAVARRAALTETARIFAAGPGPAETDAALVVEEAARRHDSVIEAAVETVRAAFADVEECLAGMRARYEQAGEVEDRLRAARSAEDPLTS